MKYQGKSINHLVAVNQLESGKKSAHMQIYGVIGQDVNGNQFANELMMVAQMGVEQIDININSSGGSIMEGMSILNAMNAARRYGVSVCTYGVGIMDSMAANILAYGDKGKRFASSFSSGIIHMPMYVNEAGEYMSIDDMEDGEMKRELMFMKDSLLQLLTYATNKEKKYLENIMREGTRRTCDELLSMGMIDMVQDVANAPDITGLDVVQAMAACSSINMNDFNIVKMSTNKDASKEAKPVENLVNQEVIKAKELEIEKLVNENKELKKKLEDANRSEIEAYVNLQIKEGKFAEERRENLINAATSDFALFKDVCGSLNNTFVDVTKNLNTSNNSSSIEDLAKKYHSHDLEGTLADFRNEVGESKYQKVEDYYTDNIEKIVK